MKILYDLSGFRLVPENDADLAFIRIWDILNRDHESEVIVTTNITAEFLYVEFSPVEVEGGL